MDEMMKIGSAIAGRVWRFLRTGRLKFHLACLAAGVVVFALQWDFSARWRYAIRNDLEVKNYTPIGLAVLLQELNSGQATVVDLRDAPAFALGHLEDALSCPHGAEPLETVDPWGNLDEWRGIILYDVSRGNTAYADKVAGILRQDGFRNVMLYEGGWAEWKACGLPVWKP